MFYLLKASRSGPNVRVTSMQADQSRAAFDTQIQPIIGLGWRGRAVREANEQNAVPNEVWEDPSCTLLCILASSPLLAAQLLGRFAIMSYRFPNSSFVDKIDSAE